MLEANQLLSEIREGIMHALPDASEAEVKGVMDFLNAAWEGDERQIKETHAALPGVIQLKVAFKFRELRSKIDKVIRATSTPAAVAGAARAKMSRFVRS
jgi:hypothetical protein